MQTHELLFHLRRLASNASSIADKLEDLEEHGSEPGHLGAAGVQAQVQPLLEQLTRDFDQVGAGFTDGTRGGFIPPGLNLSLAATPPELT